MTDQTEIIETDEDVIEVEQYLDGVYLHMDEDEYHAQRRLSASGVNALRASEADFWAKFLDPNRDDKPTKAQLLGRAFHTARLEPDMLHERFVRDLEKDDMPDGALMTDFEVRAAIKAMHPDPKDHPEALRTDTDVKNALAEVGQPKTKQGETADDRRLRLRQASAGVVFWKDVVDEWEAAHGPMAEPDGETPLQRAQRLVAYGYEGAIWAIERDKFEQDRGDRTALPSEFWDQIMRDVDDLQGSPVAEKYLTGGLAEVTVLWTDAETGVQWKARLDYLRPDLFTDAKTFVNQRGKAVRECLADAFRFNGYFIQARIYREATEEIRQGRLQVMDAVTEAETAVIDAVQKQKGPLQCVYVFQQKEGVPNVIACPIRLETLHASHEAGSIGADPEKIAEVAAKYSQPTLICRRAEHEIAEAVERYVACVERYGFDKKWRPLHDTFEITDGAFPGFWLEGDWI